MEPKESKIPGYTIITEKGLFIRVNESNTPWAIYPITPSNCDLYSWQEVLKMKVVVA